MTLEELKDLIKEVSGQEVSSLVESQIEKYYQAGYSYKEIGRCIWYFYVIKNNDPRNIEKYGIAIVPYVRGNANTYYDNLKNKQEIQKNAAERVKEQQLTEVEIKPYRRVFKKKEVDIDGL